MKPIDIAKREIGYVEGANNKNKYGEYYGINNVEWCAQFLYYCFSESGHKSAYPYSAYVPYVWEWYKARGLTHTKASGYVPKENDIVFFGNLSHIGIAISCSGGLVSCVEGNAGANTDRVKLNTYYLSSQYIYGYATPDLSGVNSNNIVEEYKVGVYKNGSTPEKVYANADLTKEIGELNPYEECKKLGKINGNTLITYRVDGTTDYKTGFVRFEGL